MMAAILAHSCMKWDYGTEEAFNAPDGLFIVNEGNFQYGNATLSFYDPNGNHAENEIFFRANGMKLGDTAQSMTVQTLASGRKMGWIVVNNSHVIFAVDLDTFREVGRITGLTSPRYIHFVSEDKAYVTSLWDNRIFIVNPRTYSVTGHIVCPDMNFSSGSTEQMVQIGRYVYVSCWSYQKRILRIDTETDLVDASLEVGIQPTSICSDRNGMLWTVTDGGHKGSSYGYEAPALFRIDPATFCIDLRLSFPLGDTVSEIQTDGNGENIFWIDGGIWKMDVNATQLPAAPIIPSRGTIYYGLTVDPVSGEIYVADAIDHEQPGAVIRFSPSGEEISRFRVGVSPGAFCWKR